MNRKCKSMYLAILMLLFVSFELAGIGLHNSTTVMAKSKSSLTDTTITQKWIKSSSKKFEFTQDFLKIRYKKKQYSLPSQLSKLPKTIQKDIQKEYVKCKVLEFKADSYSFAETLVYEKLDNVVMKMIDTNVPNLVKLELKQILDTSKDEAFKAFMVSYQPMIEKFVIREASKTIKEKAPGISDNLVAKVATASSLKGLNTYLIKAYTTGMKISNIDLANAVEVATIQSLKSVDTSNLNAKVIKLIKQILPNYVPGAIKTLEAMMNHKTAKPVIYLYPKEKQNIVVQVDPSIIISCAYPTLNNDAWSVTAFPNGTLLDEYGREYYCLYWEGYFEHQFDMTTGFVVKGSDTSAFLEEKLRKLGLTDREANEFIIYWLPQLEKNKFNLIHFATDEYIKQAPIEITPKPDTLIRIQMAFKPLDNPIPVKEQQLTAPNRNGFIVVEWGGMELK